MAELVDVGLLLARAHDQEPDVRAWIDRGRGDERHVVPAVAIAFAQRACSTAARGVEQPARPIALAGMWKTTLTAVLLDVVAAAHLADAALPNNQHAVALRGRHRAQDWDLVVAANAHGALRHRCEPSTRLLELVRDVERELYHAAKTLAVSAEDEIARASGEPLRLALGEELGAGKHADAAASARLVDAAGHALAAATLAREPSTDPEHGPWANVTNRYYH